jgi:hypothetical protein
MSVTFSYEEPNVSVFEQVDMKAGWTPSAAGLYTIVETAAKTTISYDRTSGDAWTNLKHTVDTDLFLGNHNAVKIVVKGTVGAEILVKPNDYWKTEMKIVFDGTEQTVIIPVANATKFVTLLVDPFLGSLTGSFEILELKSLFIPTGSNNVNSGWVSIDAGVYTFTPQNTGTVIVGYAKAVGQTWPAMKADFAPASALGMNTMRIVLKGTPGKSVLVKPNDSGALEQMITFADTNPVTVYVTADAFTKLLIFAEPNTEAVNGMFEILSVSLYYVKPDALPRETVVDFETGWEDGGDSVYTFAAAGGITTVTYNKTSLPWAMMQYEFSDNLSNHNTVTFVVSGTAGKQILIKLNNNNALQTNYTFLVTGAQETVKIPLTALLASVQIFAEPGDLTQTASGTFDIVSAQVTFEKEVDITSGWALNDAGTYVIGEADVDGSIDVSYTKLTFDWAYIINNFDAEAVEGCNTLTLVLIGEATKTMMLKPNDVDTPTITFTGVEQTFTFTREAFTKMVMIAAPGTQGVSGTFTIVSMVLSYVVPAE